MSRKELDDWILEMGVELHRLSSELAPAAPKVARQREWSPRVDVLETPDHVIVRVELAGVQVGEFLIRYHQGHHALVVQGERTEEECPTHPHSPHLLEIEYGRFAREIGLPEVGLDLASTQAVLRLGILTILIPKDLTSDMPKIEIERRITVRRVT